MRDSQSLMSWKGQQSTPCGGSSVSLWGCWGLTPCIPAQSPVSPLESWGQHWSSPILSSIPYTRLHPPTIWPWYILGILEATCLHGWPDAGVDLMMIGTHTGCLSVCSCMCRCDFCPGLHPVLINTTTKSNLGQNSLFQLISVLSHAIIHHWDKLE